MAAEPHTKQVQVEATLLCIEGHALWIKRFRKEQHTLLDKAYKKIFYFYHYIYGRLQKSFKEERRSLNFKFQIF